MKYSVRIEVEAEETDAAKLRVLLPQLLQGAGYSTTTGGTVIAAWLVTATEKLKARPEPGSQTAQTEWLPQNRVRRMGRGADG